MNIVLYAAAAVLVVTLPLRLWLEAREDALRRAFLVLGVNLAWTFLAWAVYLATGGMTVNHAAAVGATFLPASVLGFVSRLFPRTAAIDRRVVWLWALAPVVSVAWWVARPHVLVGLPRASVADLILALYLYAGLGITMLRLVREHRRNPRRVERARIRYLLVLLGGATLSVAAESLARALTARPETGTLDPWTGAVLLQGAVPPVGLLFVALLFFFLHQVLVLKRLLDLHEIVSRFLAVGACGLLLVLVESVAFLWTGSLTVDPLHASFLLLVATVVFLAVYDPLREVVERAVDDLLNRRGRVLELTLQEVDRALPRAIRPESLFASLLEPLVASGRIPGAAIWVRDPDRHQFRLHAWRGRLDPPPIDPVPPGVLDPPEGTAPETWSRPDLDRTASRDPAAGARARLVEAMGVDLVIPLAAGDLLLGWVGLRDEPWSDGFSREETARLRRTVDRAALVMENLHGFDRLKEQHRLAALGTMSAGLAHEIRNPLAGIKGAAQMLASGVAPEEAREFLGIILSEVDRLDRVVRQFLDYARPDEAPREHVDVRAAIARVTALLRSQDLPAGLEVVESLGEALPPVAAAPGRVEQVVLNLARNAVEAMPGGGTLTLEARPGPPLDRAGGAPSVEIRVDDTGTGIAPEDLDKIFIPFFTGRPDGVGLGLAICRRIVETHGGVLEVASRPGRGTRFTVRLPVARP